MHAWLLVPLLIPGIALASPASRAQALAETLATATAEGRFDDARALCTPAFRTRDRMSCDSLIDVLEEGATLTADRSAGAGKVGVAVLWASGASVGDPMPLWLAARRAKGGWYFFDGVDVDGTDWDHPRPEPGPPPSLATVILPDEVSAVLEALATGDREALLARCSGRMLAAEDGCRPLAENLPAVKNASFVPTAVRASDPRVAVTMMARANNRQPESGDLLFERVGGSLSLAGLTESRVHREAFLAGTLPGVLLPADLVPDPAADALGARLVQAASGGLSDAKGLYDLDILSWSDRLPAPLTDLTALRLLATPRAVVCATVDDDRVWSTWIESDDGWTVTRSGTTREGCMPDITWFSGR